MQVFALNNGTDRILKFIYSLRMDCFENSMCWLKCTNRVRSSRNWFEVISVRGTEPRNVRGFFYKHI